MYFCHLYDTSKYNYSRSSLGSQLAEEVQPHCEVAVSGRLAKTAPRRPVLPDGGIRGRLPYAPTPPRPLTD